MKLTDQDLNTISMALDALLRSTGLKYNLPVAVLQSKLDQSIKDQNVTESASRQEELDSDTE